MTKQVKYQTIPVQVDAILWTGDNAYEVDRFLREEPRLRLDPDTGEAEVWNGDEWSALYRGDWIVREHDSGTVYLLSTKEFAKRFEPIEEATAQIDTDYGVGRAMSTHEVTAEPVKKLQGPPPDGIIGYRFHCSCGRVGRGYHATAAKAIAVGHDHIPDTDWERKIEDPEPKPAKECRGFVWIGQGFDHCDICSQPWYAHEGMERLAPGPFAETVLFEIEPWTGKRLERHEQWKRERAQEPS